MVPVA
jgi:hypothetical protein